MELEGIKTKLKETLEEIENAEKFAGSNVTKFIRWSNFTSGGYWGSARTQWSTWKIYLDESKSKICVRDSQGFKIENKSKNFQEIYCTDGTRDLILSKDKESREMGQMMLTQLAEQKYGD